MRRTHWMVLAVPLLAAVLACGGSGGGSSALDDAVPTASALTLEVTGGATELTPPALQAGLAAAAAPGGWPVTGSDLVEAQKKIAAVNTALRSFVDRIEDLATLHGAPTPGEGKWYGPADRCTVTPAPGDACPADQLATFRLWVGRGPLGYTGAFLLQARATGSTDDAAFRTVAAGKLARGLLARRGHGQLWLNLQNLKEAAAGYPGQGFLYGGFFAGPVAKAETLVLVGFTPDAGNDAWPAATVAFRGVKTAAGTARVRVAALEDSVTGPNGDELGLFHVVYNPALGGRAFALVGAYTDGDGSHGDVAADHYYFGRSCYAAHSPSAPIFKEWFYCPKTQGPAECALPASANPSTIEIGTGWTQCAIGGGDPAEYDPPAGAPTADPAQPPGPLPGEGAGLTPDPAPAEGDALPEAS